MSLTFIDTNKLPKKTSAGEGRSCRGAECGSLRTQNVHGSLRWLKSTETFKADATDKHQLIYLMDGKGSIRLNDHDYEVGKGGGIYLGPSEAATIQALDATLKLFHLVVPKIPK